MKNQINIRFVVILLITTLLGTWRIITATSEVSEWANFSPIGAMALFGGTYFREKYKSYLFPLLILFISDVVLMQTLYAKYSSGLLYEGWHWTYGSFAAMVLIGELFKHKVSVKSVFTISILAALVHFILSNFGVWLKGGMDFSTGLPYAKNWSGLLNCYIAAIPYFRNLLLGNLFFGTILFGGFELAQRRFPSLRVQLTNS